MEKRRPIHESPADELRRAATAAHQAAGWRMGTIPEPLFILEALDELKEEVRVASLPRACAKHAANMAVGQEVLLDSPHCADCLLAANLENAKMSVQLSQRHLDTVRAELMETLLIKARNALCAAKLNAELLSKQTTCIGATLCHVDGNCTHCTVAFIAARAREALKMITQADIIPPIDGGTDDPTSV